MIVIVVKGLGSFRGKDSPVGIVDVSHGSDQACQDHATFLGGIELL